MSDHKLLYKGHVLKPGDYVKAVDRQSGAAMFYKVIRVWGSHGTFRIVTEEGSRAERNFNHGTTGSGKVNFAKILASQESINGDNNDQPTAVAEPEAGNSRQGLPRRVKQPEKESRRRKPLEPMRARGAAAGQISRSTPSWGVSESHKQFLSKTPAKHVPIKKGPHSPMLVGRAMSESRSVRPSSTDCWSDRVLARSSPQTWSGRSPGRRTPKDKLTALRKCVMNAPVISDVYTKYRSENLPDREFL